MVNHNCDTCGLSFQRAEHLSRHTLRHLGQRPFACPRCDLTFSRRDTMQRHLTVHDRNDEQVLSYGRTSRSAERVKRACKKCSQSKLRCDGKNPCSRCLLKDQMCSYDPSRPSKRQATMGQRREAGQLAPMPDAPNTPGDRQGTTPQALVQKHHGGSNPSLLGSHSNSFADGISSQSHLNATTVMGAVTSPPQPPPDMTVSAASGLSQQESMNADGAAFDRAAFDLQSLGEHSLYGTALNMAIWHDPQYWAPLYQQADAQQLLGFSQVGPVQGVKPGIEPAPGPSVVDCGPPVPSFVRARSSPEPQIGQFLRFDDYLRKTFIESREMRNPDNHGAALGAASAEAHSTSLVGTLSPILSSGEYDAIWEAENLAHVKPIPRRTYDHIVAKFKHFNGSSAHYTQFALGEFPSLAACNAFVHLYFENFSSLFPIIHQPSFDPTYEPWLLILAVLATGCRFSQVSAAAECADPLQEFVRRAFHATIGQDFSFTCELWLAQVGLLNQIGMQFSSDITLTELGQSMRSVLATICRKVNCFNDPERDVNYPEQQQSCGEAWKSWTRKESLRRLAYTLWLVDSQYSLFYDLPPMIPNELVRVQLPCPESLWRAPTAAEWSKRLEEIGTQEPMDICQELAYLYEFRTCRPGLGDFAILLLVLGVYRSALHVRGSSKERLYFLPTSTEGRSKQQFQQETFTVTQKAMEYLEILCVDTEDMPRPSSLKSTILHHYHVIGVLLNISLGELFCYCGYRVTGIEITRCRNRLEAWVQRGAEARQVAFHAGRLYGLIRQSSMHGYYEGRALMIACQSLWIYGELARPEVDSTHRAADHEAENENVSNPIIRLDLCLSWQAKQDWMQHGANMRPYMAGVGCILGPDGVSRLIQESHRVLCGTPIWGFCQAMGRALKIFHRLRSAPGMEEE